MREGGKRFKKEMTVLFLDFFCEETLGRKEGRTAMLKAMPFLIPAVEDMLLTPFS